MHIFRWKELEAVPWKNGQGTTREIAKETRAESIVWRLSIADVTNDGSFSHFPGMRRILTVVEGNGMSLLGPDKILQADWGAPVEFDGATPITSRLKDGPLRDLNLIFDPQICSGHISAVAGGESRHLHCKDKQVFAVFCMNGSVGLKVHERLHKGDTAILEAGTCDFKLDAASRALLVMIERHV